MKGLKLHKINPNQTLFDIAIQFYGNIEGVSWLLEDNPEINIGDEFTEIRIRDEYINKDIVQYLKQKNINIATKTKQENNQFSNQFSTSSNDTTRTN
ncbi:MAG: hypothetical protein ACPG6V_05190 [Flavobacteriales bacterium]